MTSPFAYRVGFLGCPSVPDVAWSMDNLRTLVEMGFNTIQLNIAWGARPADEPLNLEDVVDGIGLLPEHRQSLPLLSDTDPKRVAQRRADLRGRIALCREAGLRTVFHFGAPYNMHARFGDTPPNCLLDPAVSEMYAALLRAFAEQFPGVDDILVYTYDQDAWLCSEFGECPRCRGVPLDQRVSAFVNLLGRTWQTLSPQGRLWWEPWELSAGQVLRTVEQLDPSCVGLSLHSNIAEVMVTMPVDRWLKNTVTLAKRVGLPVWVEHFLGGPTEEVEPFTHLPWPLVTWRGVQAIASLDVDGIKEYYGLVPTREDPNLRTTALFLEDPNRSELEALETLAQPYGKSKDGVMQFWKVTSEAMELFPWYTSWFIREIGKADPSHSMSAAFIRGQQAHTPSWESSRRAIFMKTDNLEPDPWLLEDVQLQCELAADRMQEALELSETFRDDVPRSLREDFDLTLRDLAAWRQRTLAYAHHLRETNLTAIMRHCYATDQAVPAHVVKELRSVLLADMSNQGGPASIAEALRLLDTDPREFAATFFLPGGPDEISRGHFSVTSR